MLISTGSPASVDCIITDPPYPREYLPCFSALSESAARILKPGGSCFVMSGHCFLPEVLQRLSEHLTYHWTHAYIMPGGGVSHWARRVNVLWKPLLEFTNGPAPATKPWLDDTWKSRSADKRFHHWGQSESGIGSIATTVTQPGDLICDPFLGGGTTAFVALALGRRFIGSDTDPAAIQTTVDRINDDLLLRVGTAR